MANSEKKSRFSVLQWMTFQNEARTQTIKPIEVGRFKFYRAVFKTFTSQLFVMNLMVALCALPILLLVGLVMYMGIENFGYAVSNVSKLPYYLSNLGLGLSAGDSLAMGNVYLYQGYRVLFIGAGIFAPLIGVGLSGLQHVVNKMMWLEDFPVKYGKIGNPIPRVYQEFFVGIKQNWWETMLTLAVAGGMFIGVSMAYLNLLERLSLGTATPWSWVGVVFATIFAVIILLAVCTLIPAIPQYHGKLNYLQKAKNSLLLEVGTFFPVVFSFILIAGMVALCSINTFFQIIGIILAASLGFALIAMMQTNVMHYAAANIITPAYEIVAKRQNNSKGGTQAGVRFGKSDQKPKTAQQPKTAQTVKATGADNTQKAAQKPKLATKPVQTARPNYKKKKK